MKTLLLLGNCIFIISCANQVKVDNDWKQFYSAQGQYKVMCPNEVNNNKSNSPEIICGDARKILYSVRFDDKENLANKSEAEIRELWFEAQEEIDKMFGDIIQVEKITYNDMTFQQVILNKTKETLISKAIKEFPGKGIINFPQERIEQHRIIVKGKRVYDLRAYHYSNESISDNDLLQKNKAQTDKFFNSFEIIKGM